MEYAERGSLADLLRIGKLRRVDSETPKLAIIVQCLQDIANGGLPCLFVYACTCQGCGA